MKKYNVTVNGTVYEVTVEEADGAVAAPAAAPAPAPATPTAPAAPAAPKAAPAPAGGNTVNAPMPGTILKMNVKVGDSIKKGDLVCILEAMKMENEIFAGADGVVKAINAAQGASVNSGDAIITLG